MVVIFSGIGVVACAGGGNDDAGAAVVAHLLLLLLLLLLLWLRSWLSLVDVVVVRASSWHDSCCCCDGRVIRFTILLVLQHDLSYKSPMLPLANIASPYCQTSPTNPRENDYKEVKTNR